VGCGNGNARQISAIVYRRSPSLKRERPLQPVAVLWRPPGSGRTAGRGKLLEEAAQDVLSSSLHGLEGVHRLRSDRAGCVSLRLLTDSHCTSSSRPSAMLRWRQQFGATRPVECVLLARALHDRLIFADQTKVWSLTQSLKISLAVPRPRQRLTPSSRDEVNFYEGWLDSATPVT